MHIIKNEYLHVNKNEYLHENNQDLNKNGSMDAYLGTKYAADFHKEYKKRNNKRNSDKKKLADMCNYDYVNPDSDCEAE